MARLVESADFIYLIDLFDFHQTSTIINFSTPKNEMLSCQFSFWPEVEFIVGMSVNKRCI